MCEGMRLRIVRSLLMASRPVLLCAAGGVVLAGCAANGLGDRSALPAFFPRLSTTDRYLISGKMVETNQGDEKRICEVIGPAFADAYESKNFKCRVYSYKFYLPSGKFEGLVRYLHIDLDPEVAFYQEETNFIIPGLSFSPPDTLRTGAACGKYIMRDVAYRDIFLHVTITQFKNNRPDSTGDKDCKK